MLGISVYYNSASPSTSPDSLQLNSLKIKSLHKPLLWETFKTDSLENELQVCNVDYSCNTLLNLYPFFPQLLKHPFDDVNCWPDRLNMISFRIHTLVLAWCCNQCQLIMSCTTKWKITRIIYEEKKDISLNKVGAPRIEQAAICWRRPAT